MAAITIRNLPDEVHRALRIRAAEHGRSTEAEAREILKAATHPRARVGFGDQLRAIWEGEYGSDLAQPRDKTPHEPVDLR